MNLISTNLSQTIYISSDLITNENIIIETGATIIFCGGRIINNTDGVINIQGDNITLIAGPIQIFIGAFKFVSSYTYCAEKDLDGDVIEWTSFNDGTLIHYYCHNGMWYRK